LTKEGVGETSGQTAGSNFHLSKTDPAEETGFLRSVRGTSSAISPGPKPGRDLVLTCSPTPSFQLPGDVPGFFISNHSVVLTVHRHFGRGCVALLGVARPRALQ
jgi:hypothetical protein